MHIPDGFCSLPVNLSTAVISAGALGLSINSIIKNPSKTNRSGLLTATAAGLVFSAQMLNFPVAAGTSGHFLGTLALAALFGPARAYLLIIAVLAVQAFGFADGGILALGTNIFNMGIIGGFAGYGILRLIMKTLPATRLNYIVSVGAASWFSVILASVACSIELGLSGTAVFSQALPAMLSTHAIIGAGESLITCAIVGSLAYSRPDLLPDWSGVMKSENPATHRHITPVILIGSGVSFLFAAMLSPFASSHPDGLESAAHAMGILDRAQELWASSPLPDYTFGSISNSSLSTSIAGCIGVIAVFALCLLIANINNSSTRKS